MTISKPMLQSACATATLAMGLAFAQQAVPTTPLALLGKLTENQSFRSALEIKGDAVVSSSGALSGKATAHSARGLMINSRGDQLNGLYIHGRDANFTLSDSTLNLTGRGASDFDGVAAAVLASEGANVTLRNVTITTTGATSTAITSTEGATLKIYNSHLTANGGSLPSGYVRHVGPGMMEPPIALGVTGTARASLTMNQASTYIYNSTITSEGWGSASTDNANGHVYLEVDGSTVRTLKSGYATYADTGAEVVFNNDKVDSATYAGIIAGNGKMTMNNVAASTGNDAFLVHNVMGSILEVPQLTIAGGSYRTPNATILIRSANIDITIDHAKLLPDNGDLILSVVNDDSFATKVNGKPTHGVHATFKNDDLTGNLVHEDKEHPLVANLEASKLRGHATGVELSLDAQSSFTATENSDLTLDGATSANGLDAGPGITITAKAGPGTTLKGSYTLAHGGILIVS